MNLTLSANSELIKKARRYANDHNTTLNKMIRTFLESIVEKSNPKSDIDFFLNTVDRIQKKSNRKKWNRDEIYDI